MASATSNQGQLPAFLERSAKKADSKGTGRWTGQAARLRRSLTRCRSRRWRTCLIRRGFAASIGWATFCPKPEAPLVRTRSIPRCSNWLIADSNARPIIPRRAALAHYDLGQVRKIRRKGMKGRRQLRQAENSAIFHASGYRSELRPMSISWIRRTKTQRKWQATL